MTTDFKKSSRRLNGQMPAAFEVGYAKPPEANRFQKGKSGNPRGRPKRAKQKLPQLNDERLKSIIIAEAYRTIKVREGEKTITLSMAEAVFRSISVSAARGQHRSQRLFTQMLRTTEAENWKLASEWLQTAIEYKHEWEQEIARCERIGAPIPEPIPHPRDLEIDMKTGQVIVKGPFTPEEKVKWDKLRERKKECLEEIKFFKKEMGKAKNAKFRKFMEDEIAHEQKLYDMISRVIKD